MESEENAEEVTQENPNYKMLEIKNVTKIYKTKGGVETRALDDVSISFGQTGLVFLLGKSGSGKSTLLNVSGGLDEPTSGEVIVKGKSSKEFTGSDFDSYRNTFVGFIFQEYNILDEFNVEDNIALALELQGKPKDREKINALLRDVELEAYAKRKPNTLSGGQKQRIAIARALVKEPQIIMADEPTGALDSATGKQVFETLKKLSETRLVIVVSHDREFAEIYGDRIVELKDGKIISDVTKEHVPPEHLDDNVSIIGGNTLSIKSGSTLTAANVKTIQEFIKNTEGDVIITNGKEEIANFKKSNRMSENGLTETFGDTAPDALADKQYSKDESKFIRSRLPAAKAIKIGASGLKLKPIRLIFTIFLSCIAFTMFGLFSTLMTYNGKEVAAKSFADSGYDFINVSKNYRSEVNYNYGGEDSETYYDTASARFTEAEVAALSSEYGSATYGYFSPDNTVRMQNVTLSNSSNNQVDYYSANISKFAYVPEGNKLRTLLTGTYPAGTEEICISTYMIDVFKSRGAVFKEVTVDENGKVNNYADSDAVTVNTAQDVIGKYVALNIKQQEKAFKITGVFESGEVDGKYDKFNSNEQVNDYMLIRSFEEYMEVESLHKLALVSDDFYSEYEEVFESSSHMFYNRFKRVHYAMYYVEPNYEYDEETGEFVVRIEEQNNLNAASATPYWMDGAPENGNHLANNVRAYTNDEPIRICFFDKDKTTLADDEAIIDIGDLRNMEKFRINVLDSIMSKVKNGEITGFEPYAIEGTPQYNVELYVFAQDYYYEKLNISELYDKYYSGYYDIPAHMDGDKHVNPERVYLNKRERKQALEQLIDVLTSYCSAFDMQMYVGNVNDFDMKVVGFFACNYNEQEDGIYLTQAFMDSHLQVENDYFNRTSTTKYVQSDDEKYSGVMLEYDGTMGTYKKLAESVGVDNADEHDVFLNIENSLYNMVEMANEYAELLSTIFLGVGIVFAVFAALLLFNFVSVSISNKRKEIGILRAVGARGVDVFKIFFAESGIIVGICTLLSLVGTVSVCAILNTVLRTQIGLSISLFVFGILSVVMMIGIALVVAFISTFLPVFFAARKKPVDSIRAL